MVAVALLVAAFVTSVTVDLGSLLRTRAEAWLTDVLTRPVHIGALSVRLFDGRFVAGDVVIEGLAPTDVPFLKAREIVISIPWVPLFNRELRIDSVEMSDFNMVVESFPGGRHSFPSIKSGEGASSFTTTLQYVRVRRGQFSYYDRPTWSVVLRNLDISVTRLAGYRGHVSAQGGTVKIMDYEPMATDLRAWFRIADSKVFMDRAEVASYGADTSFVGMVDIARWPEMLYDVSSTIDLPKAREIFWAHDNFRLEGEGHFKGTFHLFKNGRELKGDFRSENVRLSKYDFPSLQGTLVWVRDRFEVLHARSEFYGGSQQFTYLMAPLGVPAPGRARLDTTYESVDLATFTSAMAWQGLRLSGRAAGHNLLEWTLGGFGDHSGEGDITVDPPAGAALLGRALPSPLPGPPVAHVHGDEFPPVVQVPVGARIQYRYGPEWIDFGPSQAATPTTFVDFQGRTAYGERSNVPFHVTSTDWQESDRLLAGIITAAGSPTTPTELGGAGVFDGVLLNSIRQPRIEGSVTAGRMKAWDVDWGGGTARLVYDNAYLDVTDGRLRKGQATLGIDGRFAMGYPRKDTGEEINARFDVGNWEAADLRHWFDLDEYPLDGPMTGMLHLYGAYEQPFGFGRLTVAPFTAFEEVFSSATAALRFEGAGVWLDAIEMQKGTGAVRGAAYVGWDATYSFNVDGRAIPAERVSMMQFDQWPLTGTVEFKASGSGEFAVPTFDVTGRMLGLFVREEGIGDATFNVAIRGDTTNFDFRAASPRLSVVGSGKTTRLKPYTGEIGLQFVQTSLDPYIRLSYPGLPPFTSVLATGTLRARGSFAKPDTIIADLKVDQADLTLYDYSLHNDGPIDIGIDQGVFSLRQLKLAGEDTHLAINGSLNGSAGTVAVHAEGAANLGVLNIIKGLSGSIRGSGSAEILADIDGPLEKPVISGQVTIANGRLRHFAMPHALENINGRIEFSGGSVRFDDVNSPLTAKLAQGDVRFGGRIDLSGFRPTRFDVSATGANMQLRLVQGLRSTVNADLTLRGSADQPTLSGQISVASAVYRRRIDLGSGLIELAGVPAASGLPGQAPEPGWPLRYDIRILAPASSLEMDNNLGRVAANADLTVRGTMDRPLIFGRVEVDRGEIRFEGQRYVITRGTVDFSNPTKIEPFFDLETETRVRAPGQTYNVTLRASGTMQRIQQLDLSSDPPLGQIEIASMLLGGARSTQDAELRQLQSPNATEQSLLQARAASLLASPISSGVQRAVEQTFGLDTVQITPLLTDPTQQSTRFAPGARVTILKKISDRVFLTYLPEPDLVGPRSGHPARVRPERSALLDSHAERGPHLRPGCPRPAYIPMSRPRLPIASIARARSGGSWRALAILAALAWAGGGRPALAQSQAPAVEQIDQYVGKVVSEIRMVSAGTEISDARLRALVDVRPGGPLSLAAVRESIVHLIGLGRYQDVRVDATIVPGGVKLVFDLVALHDVKRVVFSGDLGLPEAMLRSAVVDRFGPTPPMGRGADIASALEQFLQDHGYLRARVTPAAVGNVPSESGDLAFDIAAGPQARIETLYLTGPEPELNGSLGQRLQVHIGDRYDPDALQSRIGQYIDEWHRAGFYEATVGRTVRVNEARDGVTLTLTLDRGPRVVLEFQGDPLLPREQAELVPISREGSADRDLLEDSERRIAEYLRAQGYRDASATFTQNEKAGTLHIAFTVKRGPLYRIASVVLPTTSTLSQAEMRTLLKVTPGQPFVQARLDADVAAVVAEYRRRGYVGAKVTHQDAVRPTPALASGEQLVDSTIEIAAGPRTLVGEVTIKGNSAVPTSRLDALLQLRTGQPFDAGKVDADRDRLLLEYFNRGFRSARVDFELVANPDRTRAGLVYVINEGPEVIVDHILIVGNQHISETTIRHEITLQPGQPLGLAKINESQARLSALGLFRRVTISELQHRGETRRDVLVTVEEAPSTTIGYGGGLELQTVETSQFAPRAFFELGRRNLWGKNRSINIYSRVSARQRGAISSTTPAYSTTEYRVVGSYREPRFLMTKADLQASVLFEQGSRTSFAFRRRSFRLELARRLNKAYTVSGQYSLERNDLLAETLNPIDKPLIDRLFPSVRLSIFSGTAARDTRSDAIDPSSGSLLGLNSDLALVPLGSQIGFAKTFLQAFTYHRLPTGRRIILASGVRLGLGVGFPRTVLSSDPVTGATDYQTVRDLPANERFFAGGDTTVRGFQLDHLGMPATFDRDGQPKGGHALLVLNTELRMDVWRDVGVVSFLDAGNVFAKASDFDLGHLRAGAGFGIRYKSPIGPLRLDVGFKLGRLLTFASTRESRTALHISIGQAF